MNRLRATGFLLLISAWAAAASPPPRDSVAQRDTTAKKPDSTVKKTQHVASSAYRWPIDTSGTVCKEPLETAAECWRHSSRWANQEIGFPGARSRTMSLSTLEPAFIEPFFQPSLSESPYGTGGYIPFDRVEEGVDISEIWTPVLPLDTPITSLHWTKGALGLNQFTVNLRRMVGDRAYFGLQVHSDEADSGYYQYSFQVHQPYLAGWGIPALKRDSASLVIQDTLNAIRATEIRPRLGFWLDSQTVIEVFGDWMENTSSLANPTNPTANDSTQLLYPASFSDLTLGAVAAHSTPDYRLRAVLWHADWTRGLQPRLQDGTAEFSENASGSLDRFRLEGSPLRIPGQPQFWATAEYAVTNDAFRTHGVTDSLPAASAEAERTAIGVQAHPRLNFMELNLDAEEDYRNRPDGVQEWLGGATGDLNILLPGNFGVTGSIGWNREGASDDTLFRWQPALGLYPNPELKPRTDLHLQAGASWESKVFGLGASWESHRYEGNWLPRILPEPDVCLNTDSVRYPRESEPVCPDAQNVPDSLALGMVNYQEETRELLHLSMFLHLGNWRLSLLNTYLIGDAIRDDRRLGYTELNRQLPNRVFKGQLLWRRRLIDGKLGLQTKWDWEWFSARYVYGSDLDGYSRALKLDEYLALDFTAQMEIKTFELYFRAMNLNHDRYATEPGVHPPGVNFRFGVDWRLFN